MAGLEPTGPNAEQIRYWNELAGPKWAAFSPLINAQVEPFGLQVMDRAGIEAGAHVLDVGCGSGHTTVELARRVGPTGSVMGIDISGPLIEQAAASVAEAGAAQVRLECADAQTYAFRPGAFDLLYSRFGIMFFAQPEEAFANLRAGLRPGGRLAFACWRGLQENQWMMVPLGAVLQHVPPPPMPAPGAPGPFAFADADRVHGILTRAGFADVAFEPVDGEMALAGDGGLDAAVGLMLQVGPAGAVLREAAPETRAAVAASMREALAPYDTPAGLLLGAALWIVTARGPDGAGA